MLNSLYIPSRLAESRLERSGMKMDNIHTDLPLSYTLTGKARYPLNDMEIGEHFFILKNGRTIEQTQNAVTSCVGNIQRKTGKKFHQRRYPTGIRVWRTK